MRQTDADAGRASQWGYFDVGIYAGNKQEKASVLRRFDLGYLDVRKSAGARRVSK